MKLTSIKLPLKYTIFLDAAHIFILPLSLIPHKSKSFFVFYTFWRLLDRMEAKPKCNSFLIKSCDPLDPTVFWCTNQKCHFFPVNHLVKCRKNLVLNQWFARSQMEVLYFSFSSPLPGS